MTLAEAVARAISKLEKSMIEAALMQHRGSRTATADALGINRKTLFNKMRQYGFTEQAQDDEGQ
jgi:DNA-binding NtrC family response regulator